MSNRTCITCGVIFYAQPHKSGIPSSRKYCDSCRSLLNKINGVKSIGKNTKNENWNYVSDIRRISIKNGYASVLVGSKWLLEHRVVMENFLNRKLNSNESVHHKNGIRDDNSIDNLELWVGAIRYGQRASDIKCHNCGVSYKI